MKLPPLLPVLEDVRVVSLALNLPGPAALLRLRAMGATCTKVEPASGDPMKRYNARGYDAMHAGVCCIQLDLKTPQGMDALHSELAGADVLLTSFRPSALARLRLDWTTLQEMHPRLSQVAIVGSPGPEADKPGHDLTYLAEHGLVTGLAMPPTLFSDMGGALCASEAVLQAVLHQRAHHRGVFVQIALTQAAEWLAAPRTWGLSQADSWGGGAHAGYRVYPCKDGRVAVAALEPHFAAILARAAGLPYTDDNVMFEPRAHAAIAAFMDARTRQQLNDVASELDLPLLTLA